MIVTLRTHVDPADPTTVIALMFLCKKENYDMLSKLAKLLPYIINVP